ncbi:MAG: hypothetical protein Q4C98_10415 [Capnocytophaga sp.]|nr:hypothetical protein [Capnocytophaga sp.]
MSFVYIVSKDLNVIEIARKESDRYKLFLDIVDTSMSNLNLENHFFLININTEKLKTKIDDLLKLRVEENAIDYKDRFEETDVFCEFIYNNTKYLLCNSGFDNQIIFLINILNYTKNNQNIYCIIVKNNEIFRRLIKKK